MDDVNGIRVITSLGPPSGDPSDDNGHGTHVAGIIGARGNNGKGIAGVAWQVKLMILKSSRSDGFGDTSDAIECLEYARTKGAHIVNASWGSSVYNQALKDSIATLRSSGIIFVAAAGNDAIENDRTLTFPACYDLDNVVSVAATDRNNTLAYFSCFGYRHVALAAPGQDIQSTYFSSDTDYLNLSGTSMAAPHVAGALALLKAKVPTDSYAANIYRLLAGVDRITALEGITTSGGLLNLYRSLNSANEPSPDNDNFGFLATFRGCGRFS